MFNSSLRYHDTNRGQLRPTTAQPSIRLQGFGLRPQIFANNTPAGAITTLKNQMDIT